MEKELSIQLMSQKDINACQQIDQERFTISPYSIKAFQICLMSPTEKVLVLKEGEEIIGFIMVSLTGDEGEIYRLAVKKDYEGRGYGKLLLGAGHKYMSDKGVKTSFLEVRKNNIRALGLYQKDGYQLYRVRKNYYADLEDADCLKKGL